MQNQIQFTPKTPHKTLIINCFKELLTRYYGTAMI